MSKAYYVNQAFRGVYVARGKGINGFKAAMYSKAGYWDKQIEKEITNPLTNYSDGFGNLFFVYTRK